MALEAAAQLESPRVIKTHLPIDMLPPTLLDTAKANQVYLKIEQTPMWF